LITEVVDDVLEHTRLGSRRDGCEEVTAHKIGPIGQPRLGQPSAGTVGQVWQVEHDAVQVRMLLEYIDVDCVIDEGSGRWRQSTRGHS
jgi:hypothetical protein